MKLPLILSDLVHLYLSFIDLRIGRHHIYINMLMQGLYNYWWRVNSFEYRLGKEKIRTFYVANVIKLRLVSELLWKFNLLARYKLNIFRPPRVNQFDIRALLFGGYARFTPLDKTVFYGYWKPCLLEVSRYYI